MTAMTLFDKIWQEHVVRQIDEATYLIYIDRHLLHEANTPHAFEGLRLAGRTVRRPDLTIGVVDHTNPTTDPRLPIRDEEAKTFIRLFAENCKKFEVEGYSVGDPRQGIVHVIGPERGFTLPGCTLVCGDSHTSTHGAFGAWAFGIGISEVEHVFATQTVVVQRPKNMNVRVSGKMPAGVTAKDLVLSVIGKIGTAGGTSHVIEFSGPTISAMSMEERMTICNMAIEAGARAGIVAPDQTTYDYLKGRALVPEGDLWDWAVSNWNCLKSDEDAVFDRVVAIDVSQLQPHVTWGTSPQDVLPIGGRVPDPLSETDPSKKAALERAISYMGLEPGGALTDVRIDRVFIGSCTNSRISDLRSAAAVVAGKHVAAHVNAWVVPGSQSIKRQAEMEGLDKVFLSAGFQWRSPGCSMCLAMNEDHLEPGERCAATSNRNFEGRQGRGGRTHLMSPAMAAAAAICGHLTDIRELVN